MRHSTRPASQIRRILLTGATLALVAMVPVAQAAPVKTAQGSVQAMDRGGMRSFFAIPHAAPPVGDLRWAAPQPAAKWTATRAQAKSAAPCLQTGQSLPGADYCTDRFAGCGAPQPRPRGRPEYQSL